MIFHRLILILLVAIFISFLFSQPILASTYSEVMGGFKNTGKAVGFPQGSEGKPKVEFAAAWISYANGMIMMMGALLMIMYIYAGWLWMSAQGKEEQIQKAKHIMINTSIGLLVILAARLIVEVAIRAIGAAAL